MCGVGPVENLQRVTVEGDATSNEWTRLTEPETSAPSLACEGAEVSGSAPRHPGVAAAAMTADALMLAAMTAAAVRLS